MTGFLHRIKSLARGTDTLRESPFASVRATQKWLQNLPGLSDYDVHHALVEGLERYNGDIRGDTLTSINLQDMLDNFGAGNLRVGRGLVERALWLPAQRLARQVCELDERIGQAGLQIACRELLLRYVNGIDIIGA